MLSNHALLHIYKEYVDTVKHKEFCLEQYLKQNSFKNNSNLDNAENDVKEVAEKLSKAVTSLLGTLIDEFELLVTDIESEQLDGIKQNIVYRLGKGGTI